MLLEADWFALAALVREARYVTRNGCAEPESRLALGLLEGAVADCAQLRLSYEP